MKLHGTPLGSIPQLAATVLFAVLFMYVASRAVVADVSKSGAYGCVNLREAPRISLKPEQIKWEKHTVIPGVKFKDPNHEPAMIAYVEGSVTSDSVRVQVISYPPGISSAPHKHPAAERAYVIDGSVNMVIGDGTDKDAINYPAGSYYTVPANTRHYMFSTEKTKVLVMMGGAYQAEPVEDSPDFKLK